MFASRIIAIAMVVACATPMFAQDDRVKFKLGDEVPDIAVSKAWNDQGRKKLSDFRGEFVHLIFWGTG